jgi:hypothetical protein
MSSTGKATFSPPNVQLIIDALADYAKLTGIDLTKSPFSATIERRNSPEEILELFQEREGGEEAFKEYREGISRLISYLSPIVKVLHAHSGIAGEAVSLVSVTYQPVNHLTRPHQVPFSPATAVFTSIDVLLDVRAFNTLFN